MQHTTLLMKFWVFETCVAAGYLSITQNSSVASKEVDLRMFD